MRWNEARGMNRRYRKKMQAWRARKKMRAYWAHAEMRERRTIDRLNFTSWFNLWHTHPDWYGRGNTHPSDIPEIAAMTVRLLRYMEMRAQGRSEPIQLWAMLHGNRGNAADNAVYAHSPNPYDTPYPCDFPMVTWDAPVPDWVSTVVPDTHQIGTGSDDNGFVYFIRQRPNPRQPSNTYDSLSRPV